MGWREDGTKPTRNVSSTRRGRNDGRHPQAKSRLASQTLQRSSQFTHSNWDLFEEMKKGEA